MLKLELKSVKNVVVIEEDSIPKLCGLNKGEDLALSLSIKVYNNVKGKRGKQISSYSKTWFISCSERSFKRFLLKFLCDVDYREQYKLSLNSWTDEYMLSNEEILLIENFIEENKSSILSFVKKSNAKSIKNNPNSRYYNSVVKNEAMSLLVSNEEILALSKVFVDKKDLVYAICEVAKGKSVEDTINDIKTNDLIIA